jgi:hypothetical protein
MVTEINSITHPIEKFQHYENIAVNFEFLMDYRNSLNYFKKAQLLKDSFYNAERKEKINELTTLFETERKNNIILTQKATLSSKNLFITVLFFISILLGLSIAILFWRNKMKQKSNEILLSKNKKNEMLIQELHHRVKNNIQFTSSLLSLQSMKMEDGDAKDAI